MGHPLKIENENKDEEMYFEPMIDNHFLLLLQQEQRIERISLELHFKFIRFDFIVSTEENLYFQLDFDQCSTKIDYDHYPRRCFLQLFSIDQINLHDYQQNEHSMIFSSTSSSSNRFLQMKFEKKAKLKSFIDFYLGKFNLNLTRRQFVDFFFRLSSKIDWNR
jgi:hypothetical protein